MRVCDFVKQRKGFKVISFMQPYSLGRVKKELVQEITSNGGEICFGVTKNTTHLITTEKDVTDLTFVVRTAIKNGCWIVMPSFVFDSTRVSRRDKEWNHMIIGSKVN